jgi:hypothetical protein
MPEARFLQQQAGRQAGKNGLCEIALPAQHPHYSLMLLQVLFQLQHNLANSHDGWIMDPSDFGSVAREDGFFPLDSIVNDPAAGVQHKMASGCRSTTVKQCNCQCGHTNGANDSPCVHACGQKA